MNQPAPSSSPDTTAQGRPAKKVHFMAVNRKIYPRSVKGRFDNWRWILWWAIQSVFYGLCWLPWNGRQAFLFDLTERKFYVFDLVFWPQDVIYLALLLIISAYGLFLFTAIGGRLFCGYACPQTLFTSLFLWIEEKIEGPYNLRQKLDQQPMSARKLRLKTAKHGAYLLISLWTGFTFVGYFTPMRTLMHEVASFSLGPWEIFWILFYGLATYGNAGFMREQMCLFMCPYARFQSVMFDPDTLVVTYDAKRGESRGPRKKTEDYKAAGKGDCVDCGICVQVCPTGIDIRDGLQYECIGCSACIDACDQVMDKVGYPRGLIRYSTEQALEKGWGGREILRHLLRLRILIYGFILILIVGGTIWGIATRQPLRFDVIRDRGVMSREIEDGQIENLYRLKLMNVSEADHHYRITVSGLAGVDFVGDHQVEVSAGDALVIPMAVRVPAESGRSGKNLIQITVQDRDDPKIQVTEDASFLMP